LHLSVRGPWRVTVKETARNPDLKGEEEPGPPS
jgi:hypothetical protein